jgi:signal transduction histidine kinase
MEVTARRFGATLTSARDFPRPSTLAVAGAEQIAGTRGTSMEDLIDRLVAHRTIGTAPRHELAWLAAHGRLERYRVGQVVYDPSEPVEDFFVLLSGRMAIFRVQGEARHKILEWHAGDVTGVLPYSRLTTPPGPSVIEEPTEALVVPREHLAEMTRECHEMTSILVHVMVDRARTFTSTFLHDEKLTSLGKLAAGLAHELNNPAAAITRSAQLLRTSLAAMESATRALGAAGLTGEEAGGLAQLREQCLATPVRKVLSPVEAAEREEALGDWLESRGVDAAAAEGLAETPLTLDLLDRFAGAFRPGVLGTVLRWLAADCAVGALAMEIEQAGTRISDLVAAVRGFTRVDAAAAPGAVEVGEGLAQTLAVMRGKARGKSIQVDVSIEPGLPPVRAVAAELNQIWANLVDNAIDAAPPSGRVEVTARRDGSRVVVRVVDDGPGIPPTIRERIFDPFFTTKDVGKGTGLGLDIVRRLVARNDGDVQVQSEPGRTEFAVSLPVPAASGVAA